ncbi:hypothetical protein TNCT_374981 [Trichonephila clavata]|uniref:Transposase n=1 Tax=Trichonephila clavata TaxID=2740835 RepID=A0A8X6G3V4_TRICU|nr:hypothetical protein TNCT_374981 [Trichonephila clavata]
MFDTCSYSLFIGVKKLLKQPGTFAFVYGKGIIGKSTARKWFAKFKNSDFDVDETLCSGKPSEFDEECHKAHLKKDGHQTSRELAENINCDHKTILNHLLSMEFAKKYEALVPHELNKNHTKKNPPSNCVSTSSPPSSSTLS